MDFHNQQPAASLSLSPRNQPERILRQACPSDDQRGTCSRSMISAQRMPNTWNAELRDAFRNRENRLD